MPSPFASTSWILLLLSQLFAAAPSESDTTLADSVFAESTPAPPGKVVVKTAEPELKAPKGSLAILSNPTGAQLIFNSVKQGKTPVIVKLTKPLNRIVVKMHGYEAYDAMIEKNTLRRELTVTLKPEGIQQPSMQPSPAVVVPESKPIPVAQTEVKPASPQPSIPVVAVKPDLKPVEKPVPVAPVPVPSVPLPPPAAIEMGTVFFSSSPSNAGITLDGKPTGKQTPVKIDLPVGVHHVEMERDGLRGLVDYSVIPGNNKALHLQLQ